MGTANSFGFKFESTPANLLEKDFRIGSIRMQKAPWFTFELSSDADLHEGLEWLSRAFRAAGKTKKSQ